MSNELMIDALDKILDRTLKLLRKKNIETLSINRITMHQKNANRASAGWMP